MEFTTSTLNLASALSIYFPLKRVDYEGNRAVFVFDDSVELQETIQSYWDDTLQVPAQKILVTAKLLKSRIAEKG